MISIGHFALVIAWLLSLYGICVGTFGAIRGRRSLTESAARSVVGVSVCAVISLVSLAVLFLRHDYSYAYVWRTSNNSMPAHYLVSAIWGGMDGSMLLWAVMVTVFAALAVLRVRDIPRSLRAWLIPVLSVSSCFFLFVVTFLTNPFRLTPSAVIPLDGSGLNPLLQNPSMLIHPPSLYLGFTGFMVPAAFCIAALLSGNLNDTWTRVTRRWSLFAWGFLTAGIILGGNWAYIELGWGGFWAWDPVENASFLPWLTGTAYIHSVMVTERRQMLKIWTIVLSLLTYILAVFGTFLTRSGVVQSVHAFAETDIGWVFLAFIGVMIVGGAALIWWRRHELRAENKLESWFSREAAFLVNNLFFLAICFATLWGVMFPVISEALAGEKSVVGPPFFNKVNIPFFLGLLFLMSVGPIISWRKMNAASFKRLLLRPFIFGSLVTVIGIVLDPTRIYTAVAFGLCALGAASTGAEFYRAAKVRRQLQNESVLASVGGLFRKKSKRYGGLLVHVGVLVMAISIAASMSYKIEKDILLSPGEEEAVGRFVLRLDSIAPKRTSNYEGLVAQVSVFDARKETLLGILVPERRFYPASQETTTEVDIRMTPVDDLYLALAGLDDPEKGEDLANRRAVIKVFVNPLQMWLWVGALIVLAGTVVVIGPLAVPVRETEGAAVRAGAAA